MDDIRTITLPMTPEVARSLKLGEMIYLDGQINATAGIPTHARILDYLDRGEPLPVDLNRAAFFHLGSYSEEKDGEFDVLYMNPTTSTRFNSVMPRIIRELDLACVGGKGGLDAECARALKDVGGVYLSFLGGGCPLLSASIRHVVKVAWQDMISHYRLVVLEVERLGPLTVAIDADGNSLYDNLADDAQARRADVLAKLAAARG
ncbi:fumarate hydratase C-terminal domain-containing protein [Sulfitobacter sp. F26204]|uniref:fumarate hydratase C-terminal domain-containing protein n=1 Tax=Sulfitobacter sp. F26204 TaxID=2996014 RepID=UPI00225DF83B|nr:fumarate hydratase C-terminal domain-containing protein [Sulfitobacter sp. F26204]MCX7561349.1 fumarate hydratase C-terminal domain-containing protein [Sulfitobacter sp. F26204]